MIRAHFHAEAERELNEAAVFYESRVPGLGKSFLDTKGDARVIGAGASFEQNGFGETTRGHGLTRPEGSMIIPCYTPNQGATWS